MADEEEKLDPAILEEPEFQAMVLDAVKTIDIIAQISDDNSAEIPFVRNGVKMIITIRERTEEETFDD